MKKPTSTMTIGRLRDPETISAILRGFGASYNDYEMIKVNGRPIRRNDRIIYGGDILQLFKKER